MSRQVLISRLDEMNSESILSLLEASHRYGIQHRVLLELVEKGVLPATKIGGYWWFNRFEEKYIEKLKWQLCNVRKVKAARKAERKKEKKKRYKARLKLRKSLESTE